MRYLFIFLAAIILVAGVRKVREARAGEALILRARVIELQNQVAFKHRMARQLRSAAATGLGSTPVQATVSKVYNSGTRNGAVRMIEEAADLETQADFDQRALLKAKDQLSAVEHGH